MPTMINSAPKVPYSCGILVVVCDCATVFIFNSILQSVYTVSVFFYLCVSHSYVTGYGKTDHFAHNMIFQ